MALLIISSMAFLNSSGVVYSDISSPLAPKHGWEAESDTLRASNAGSLCIGRADLDGSVVLGATVEFHLACRIAEVGAIRLVRRQIFAGPKKAGSRDGPGVALGHASRAVIAILPARDIVHGQTKEMVRYLVQKSEDFALKIPHGFTSSTSQRL